LVHGAVRRGRHDAQSVPTITVKRLTSDGPFHGGAIYEVAAGNKDEHFGGIVCDVAPIDEKWVAVKIALTAEQHERLLASNR
jgi:hypothetical protein